MASATESHLLDEALKNGWWIVDDVNEFLMGGGGQPAKFKEIGDGVKGQIIHSELRQQLDIQTSEPLFWKDGNPRMQLVVTLQTELSESEEDDGLRRIYVRGQMQKALADAVRAKGEKGIANGGQIAVQYVADGEAAQRGFNAPKQYQVWYWPPPEGFTPIEEPRDEPEPSFNEQMAGLSPDDIPF